MSAILRELSLNSNPFEPSATGVPLVGILTLPDGLATATNEVLALHDGGIGTKVITVIGDYGSGKTCLLQWLHRQYFPDQRIKSFYLDNPGVQFYDVANELLRDIGRKDFAKFIWELAGSYVTVPLQRHLFEHGFEEYLTASYRRGPQKDLSAPLQSAIMNAEITNDEEIAHRLARIVTDIVKKPYFEYRDFLPRLKGSLVAERQEAPYFKALLKAIAQGTGANGIGLVIDEFEEIGLQKRLTKRAAHDYLATVKRLINLVQSDDVPLWIIMSMTQDAYDKTVELEPAFMQRVYERKLTVEPLSMQEALALIERRVASVRVKNGDEAVPPLFPFPETMVFRPRTYSNPRRLVKTCFRAIAEAVVGSALPFRKEHLHRVEEELYSIQSDGERC